MSDNPHDANETAPASPTAQPELPKFPFPVVKKEDEDKSRELIYWSGAQGNCWNPTAENGYASMYARERELKIALADAATQRDRADKAERERDEARGIARRLANAIQRFRNCKALAKLTGLRGTAEYGELCRAWDAHNFDTDSWQDMIERAESAEAANLKLREHIEVMRNAVFASSRALYEVQRFSGLVTASLIEKAETAIAEALNFIPDPAHPQDGKDGEK